jgi:hypothetical protein
MSRSTKSSVNNKGASYAKEADTKLNTALRSQVKDDTRGFNHGAFTKGLPNQMAQPRDYSGRK